MMRRSFLASIASMLPICSHSQIVFPKHNLTIIVPFAPGGTTDLLGRAIASALSASLGKPVLIENRPGGGTTIAAQHLTRSPADGHTLLLASTSTLVIHPLLNQNPGFDVEHDLTGVTMLAFAPMVLLVNARSKYKSASDLVQAARLNPGKLNFASPGYGTSLHLAAELFTASNKINCVHVPYRGSQQALLALLADEVQFYFDLIPTAKSLIESDQLIALGVTHRHRVRVLPNVPTLAEQGWQDFDASARFSLVAPANTPESTIFTLNQAVSRILADTTLKSRFSSMGLEISSSSPKDVLKQFALDRAEWAPLIRDRHIRLE